MLGLMRGVRGVGIVAAVVVLLVGALVAGLRWGPLGGSDGLTDALDLVPADTEIVLFSDAGATADRLDVTFARGDLDDAAAEDYATAIGRTPWLQARGAGQLTGFERVMDDSAWSALDVRWAAEGRSGDTTYSVLGLADTVDPEELADELVDRGYDESDRDGFRSFEIDRVGDLDGDYPPLQAVTLLDDGVVVLGPPGPVLEVVAGDAPSMADEGTFDDVLDGVGTVELALLRSGDQACGGSGARGVRPDDTPTSEMEASAVLVVADGDDARGEGRLEVDDEATAGADVQARETYLAEGRDPVTGFALDDLVDVDEVESDGAVVTVRYTTSPGSRLDQLTRQGTVAACGGG